MTTPRSNEIVLTDLHDFYMSLGDLRYVVNRLIDEHGETSMIFPDAGANNVSFHMVKETINYSKVSTRFVTVNPQKDGRVVLGTSVHKFQDCQTLKRRSIVDISGSPDLIKHFQKCTWCYNRKD